MFRRLLFVATAATVAFAGCTSTPAAPALTDPKDILTKSVLTLKDIKSMHFHADVSGTVKLDLTGTGNAGALDLKGTTADGDIDISNKKLHISFGAPALLGVAGDVIVIGDTTYAKVTPFLGTKYMKSTSTSSTDPITSATDPLKTIDEINKFLDTPGVAPTKQADEKCGDKDCYRVSMNLTSEQLSGVTSGLSSAAPTGTGKIDVWVQKNDLRPAKISVDATAGDQGTVNLTMTISNYDAAVTVNPPADADIAPAAS
jgi:hypothetical protein